MEEQNTGKRGGVVLWRRWRRSARERTRLGDLALWRDATEATGWPCGVGEADSRAERQALAGYATDGGPRPASGFGGSLPEGGMLSEKVREDRLQVVGDLRTGGDAETGVDSRDDGEVLGRVEGVSEEGAGSRG